MQDGTFLCKMVFVSLLHVSYFPRSDIDPEKRQKTPFFIFPGTYHCTWHALCYDRRIIRQGNQFSIRSCLPHAATTFGCRAIGSGCRRCRVVFCCFRCFSPSVLNQWAKRTDDMVGAMHAPTTPRRSQRAHLLIRCMALASQPVCQISHTQPQPLSSY